MMGGHEFPKILKDGSCPPSRRSEKRGDC